MQDVSERLKLLRKSLNLNQTAFGEKLGVTRSVIKNLELGTVEVKEHMLKLICSLFSVNEEWLRTGEGEMLNQTDDAILSAIANQYGADELDKRIIEVFLRLPPEQRKAFSAFATQLADNLNADDKKADK